MSSTVRIYSRYRTDLLSMLYGFAVDAVWFAIHVWKSRMSILSEFCNVILLFTLLSTLQSTELNEHTHSICRNKRTSSSIPTMSNFSELRSMVHNDNILRWADDSPVATYSGGFRAEDCRSYPNDVKTWYSTTEPPAWRLRRIPRKLGALCSLTNSTMMSSNKLAITGPYQSLSWSRMLLQIIDSLTGETCRNGPAECINILWRSEIVVHILARKINENLLYGLWTFHIVNT